MEFDTYGAKIIYKYSVEGHEYYEESILHVKARTFEDAYKKVEQYAEGCVSVKWINANGFMVNQRVFRIAEFYGVNNSDEENGILEIYSNIKKNKTGLSELDYVDILCRGCTKEEMWPLRQRIETSDRQRAE